MNTRALSFALLPIIAASVLLAGCGSSTASLPGMANSAQGRLGARGVAGEDPMPFLDSAKKAIALIQADKGWKNPVLISIEGRGLDQNGRLVPLLGASWTFKFWANKIEEGETSTELTRVDVIQHVEGNVVIGDGGETADKPTIRVLDPVKLSPPTEVVPFAIRLGLKVNPAGPSFNYYDVVYNSFYANPAFADTNVADVVSYYQRETFDGLHIPADAGLLPKPTPAAPPAVTPAPAPAPVPVAKPGKKPARLSQAELVKDQADRNTRNNRQHTRM